MKRTYHVEKLASDFSITENRKRFYFSGINWGVFDESGKLHFTTNCENKKMYSVFGTKYVATYEANHLTGKELGL